MLLEVRKRDNNKHPPAHGRGTWSSPQCAGKAFDRRSVAYGEALIHKNIRLPRTGSRTEEPALSALTAPGPLLRPTGTAHPAAVAAPGCGAGRVEGPSQAPRPAGVFGAGPKPQVRSQMCPP